MGKAQHDQRLLPVDDVARFTLGVQVKYFGKGLRAGKPLNQFSRFGKSACNSFRMSVTMRWNTALVDSLEAFAGFQGR